MVVKSKDFNLDDVYNIDEDTWDKFNWPTKEFQWSKSTLRRIKRVQGVVVLTKCGL